MKKLIMASMITVMGCGMASAQMPTMNATDHVYGYHLRDVYKDMGALKEGTNDLSNKLDSINSRGDVLANSVTNITTDIANTSNRIDRMENTFNNSITNITNDMGVIKNDMADSKRNIDKLNHHVSSLHNDVSALRGDLSKLKSDTHKGLAQANALSGLKYLGGKGLQLSVALGGYRGQSAIAYGMFYGINDDLMLYAGGTDDSYNASINVRIGGK